jgi:hypothetical protein
MACGQTNSDKQNNNSPNLMSILKKDQKMDTAFFGKLWIMVLKKGNSKTKSETKQYLANLLS